MTATKQLYDSIKHGSKVTILVPAGLNPDGTRGWKRKTGRAVMLGPAGWILNLGGRYGTPGIASPSNTVAVRE